MMKKFKVQTAIRAATLALFTLSLTACLQNDQRTSNLKESDDQVASLLDARLKNSARMSTIVEKIDTALRPVTNILSDIEKILKADEKEQIRGKVSELKNLSLSKIRGELDRMKRGLVSENKDGSWEIDQTVEWPFERGEKYSQVAACGESTLTLKGESLGSHGDQLSLLLSDCALAGPTALLVANVSENLDIDAELNLGSLEDLVKPGVRKGPCSIKSTLGLGTQMECESFTEISGTLIFEFEKISYIRTSAGENMDFSLKISDFKGGRISPLVRASLVKSIGQPSSLKVERL